MSSVRHQRVKAIFGGAVELAPGERAAFLDAACGSDERLRADVEALLAHDAAPHFDLDTDARGFAASSHPPMLERVGRYRITGMLGTGGMGVVYRAESTNPSRAVALKLLRTELLGATALRRFELESDALARLQHPGIAQVFESGTAEASGVGGPQPFIAMELVEGLRLSEHARERGLDRNERIRLVIAICDAVEHAHRRGVVHRDIKPGNVIVQPDGQPKILDFGIARLVGDETSATLRTETGQLVGTIAYMSPEQVEGRSRDVDTRTDVYALGVLLFELLADDLPHDLAERSVPEAARIVRDDDPRTLSSFDRSLRGDLETIVQHALEHDPERRYQSAEALGDDLRRFLGNEPIRARPANTLYQLRKFARRNRVLVGGVVLVFLSLVGGVVATGGALAEARENLDRAKREARKANEVAEFVRNTLAEVDPGRARGDAVTVREALEQAAGRVGDLDDEPEVAAAVHQTMGDAFRAIGVHDQAEFHLSRALELRLHALGADHEDTAKSRVLLGDLYVDMDAYDRAEPLYRDAQEALPREHRHYAQATRSLGRIAMFGQDTGAAEAQMLEAMAIYRDLGDDFGVEVTQNDLALVMLRSGRVDEAEELLRAVVASRRARWGSTPHPHMVPSLTNLAQVLRRTGRAEEALPFVVEAADVARLVYGEIHPQTETALNNLGTLHRTRGDLAAAAEAYTAALEIRRALDSGGPRLAMITQNLASLMQAQGRTDEAAALFDEALVVIAERGLEETVEHSTILINRGALDRELGRDAESIAGLEHAVTIRRRLLPGQPRLSGALAGLARSHLDRGRDDDIVAAEKLFREAVEIGRSVDPRASHLADSLAGLGESLVRLGRTNEAMPVLEEAVELSAGAPTSLTARRSVEWLEKARGG